MNRSYCPGMSLSNTGYLYHHFKLPRDNVDHRPLLKLLETVFPPHAPVAAIDAPSFTSIPCNPTNFGLKIDISAPLSSKAVPV